MRRSYTILSLFTISLLLATACRDELAERYQSPHSAATPAIGEFFTAMLNNDRVRPSYWNVSTFVNWHVGVYSQSVGYLNGPSMYQQNEAYIQERWDDFYRPGANGSGVMAVFREIEKASAGLPKSRKREGALFLNAARIVLFDQTSQMIDLWGDIPFSEAGALNASGAVVYPVYDDAEELYRMMIEQLDGITKYFLAADWGMADLASFGRQDILLSGNVSRWVQYCNSLRLRLLMRMSFFDEEFARVEVLKMLDAPAIYPLLDEGDYVPGLNDVLLHPVTTYIYDLHDAFTDWTNFPAPYFALEQVLAPANDIRMPVLYDKYGASEGEVFIANQEYRALPLTLQTNEQKENLEHYAILDSVTFLFNSRLPGVVMTASEVSFLKAEARERWGGGDAAADYLNGIRQSIRFYYYLNGLNTIGASSQNLSIPGMEEIENFIASSGYIQYSGTRNEKLEKIWTQKWLHLGFLQASESWAEIRRTGYPKIEFHASPLTGFEYPPNRLTYPGNEKSYNDNYAKVSSKDHRETRIFWQNQ